MLAIWTLLVPTPLQFFSENKFSLSVEIADQRWQRSAHWQTTLSNVRIKLLSFLTIMVMLSSKFKKTFANKNLYKVLSA